MASELEVGGLQVADGSNDVAVNLGNSSYGMALDYSSGDLSLKTNAANRLTVSNTGHVSVGSGSSAPGSSSPYSYLNGLRISGGDASNTIYNAHGNIGITTPNGGLSIASSTGLCTFTDGIKNEKGIYGGQITIADDAVGTITPPRQGVMMAISYNNDQDYPTHETYVGIVWCDTGASQNVTKLTSQGGGITTHSGVDLTAVGESSSVDGHLNISTVSGTIQLKNRISGSATWWYNFIA